MFYHRSQEKRILKMAQSGNTGTEGQFYGLLAENNIDVGTAALRLER